MSRRDNDLQEMRGDGEFAVHRQDGGPYRRHDHLRSDVVNVTEEGTKLLIRFYYPNA